MTEIQIWSVWYVGAIQGVSGTRLREGQRLVLKSDYDALKKENEELSTSESEYQKVCEFIAKNFGDLSCCYDAEDVIGLAQSAVDRLKSKLEKAEAVISFYASEDTWINKEFDEKNNFIGWTQKKPNDVSIFPYSIGNSNGNFHCLGSRAREYLKGE